MSFSDSSSCYSLFYNGDTDPVADLLWHGVSLLVRVLSGGMGRPSTTPSLDDVRGGDDGGYRDEVNGRSRYYSHNVPLGQAHDRRRVVVCAKGAGSWASPQPSGSTAVALVLSVVLVLVVQVGVWLLVIRSGGNGRDGVGSAVIVSFSSCYAVVGVLQLAYPVRHTMPSSILCHMNPPVTYLVDMTSSDALRPHNAMIRKLTSSCYRSLLSLALPEPTSTTPRTRAYVCPTV